MTTVAKASNMSILATCWQHASNMFEDASKMPAQHAGIMLASCLQHAGNMLATCYPYAGNMLATCC